MLASSAVWASAAAELDLAFVEMLLELGPLFGCHVAVFVRRSHLPPALQVCLVVLNNVFIEDRHIAAEGIPIQMA
ncbi:hypothetical protein ACQP1G_35030 [Nocardia sp. CA-107356]|uniref:hypothetical protein n=1 Tax=Nocardia sp. CA-107356 TaxID=3239972 RepID=UPI003D8D21A8